MRKLALLLVVPIILLIAAPAASAWHYKVPFPVAENKARRFTKEFCLEDTQCVAWGVKCARANQQVVICSESTWDELAYLEPDEYFKCSGIERFGIRTGGYLSEKLVGKLHCEVVYEP